MSVQLSIYQIFYDEQTRNELDAGYLPLDNSDNPRPDWFEFWSIRQYLLTKPLDEAHWYGFFSPRFAEKTRLSSADVSDFIATIDGYADVALFSPYWDQIAYFQNSFEQGEYYHPGLMDVARRFFAHAGIDIDLDALVSDSSSTVFSNYIVARPPFWRHWLKLAEALYDFVENSDDPAAIAMRDTTNYKGGDGQVAMKVFIQERLAGVILAGGGYRTATIDISARRRPPGLLPPAMLRSLQSLDLLKQQFRRTGDATYLEAYRKLRATIPMGRPAAATPSVVYGGRPAGRAGSGR